MSVSVIYRALLTAVLFAYSCLIFASTCTEGIAQHLSVSISGIENELLSNAYAHLSINAETNCLTEETSEQLILQGTREIADSLKPYGYYDPQITHQQIEHDKTIELSFNVSLGAPIKIGTFELKLNGDMLHDDAFLHAIKNEQLYIGNILDQPQYERLKKLLHDHAHEHGYFNAKLNHAEIKIDLLNKLAFITIDFDSGSHYRIGHIYFDKTTLSEDYLEKFLPFKKGDFFENSKIQKAKDQLLTISSIRRIIIRSDYQQADDTHHIPLYIEVHEKPKQHYEAGIGYGTDTGGRILFNSTWRKTNRKGHSVDLHSMLAQYRRIVQADYLIPGGDPLHEQIGLKAAWILEHPPSQGQTITDKLSAEQKLYFPSLQTLQILGISFQHDEYREGHTHRSSTLIIPSLQWQWTSTPEENRANPSKGTRLDWNIRGSSHTFGANRSFIQSEIQIKHIIPLNKNNRLLLRGKVGASLQDDIDALPPSLRYYAGGDNSVRGYRYKALGPSLLNQHGDSEIGGGKYLLESSVEFEHALNENWRIATFYDMGNAMNTWNTRLAKSLGIGLRWVSPFGLMRIDLARALDDKSHPIRIHFTFGPDL